MPCDRCGGRLVEYELQGRVSTVCEECESIDVLVEHGPPSRPSESWDEALDRFHEQVRQSDDADAASATEPARDAPSEADGQAGSVPDVLEDEQEPSAGPGSPDDDNPETAGDADDGGSAGSQDDLDASADGDDSGGTEDQPSSRRRALEKVPRE